MLEIGADVEVKIAEQTYKPAFAFEPMAVRSIERVGESECRVVFFDGTAMKAPCPYETLRQHLEDSKQRSLRPLAMQGRDPAGNTIYLNVNAVNYLLEDKSGGTVITFNDGFTITVQDPIEVMREMFTALPPAENDVKSD